MPPKSGEPYTVPYKSEQTSPECVTVRFDNVAGGWEQWILLSSDRHHDSVRCNRELELRHLKLAKERKAAIIDVGDLFDVMQGKFDPRRSYSGLRPEYKVDTYLDEIVRDAAEFYKPYAHNFLLFGRGNHDQGIIKNNGVDLISNLVYALNSQTGSHIYAGGYGGWVRFQFTIQKTVSKSLNLKYFHGAGGGGPVTRGVIQTNRQAVYLPDADIVVNGHTHNSFIVPIARERLSDRGVVVQDTSWYLRTPTYANDYGNGTGGWHVERWGEPKSMGAVWLHLSFDGSRLIINPQIDII